MNKTRIATIAAIASLTLGTAMLSRLLAQSGQGRTGDHVDQQQQPDAQRRTPRDRDMVVNVKRIPVFMQAGRSYVFEPVVGERFSGKVVSLDATGWVQVQHRPGGDVGPLAEWYNLDNMVSIKAMN
jgi:hypothetical protein